MTTQMMIDLPDSCYAVGVDAATVAILDLIAGDPIHERDREAIVNAIRESVLPDGTTSRNEWAERIPPWVYHRVIGATVHALAKAGVIVRTGNWVVSNDVKGRNGGKPAPEYRWVGVR